MHDIHSQYTSCCLHSSILKETTCTVTRIVRQKTWKASILQGKSEDRKWQSLVQTEEQTAHSFLEWFPFPGLFIITPLLARKWLCFHSELLIPLPSHIVFKGRFWYEGSLQNCHTPFFFFFQSIMFGHYCCPHHYKVHMFCFTHLCHVQFTTQYLRTKKSLES